MAYKYNELQMSDATQKLSDEANCKSPLFFIVFLCFNVKVLINASNFKIFKGPSTLVMM
jgi:hypothetical protein